MKFKYALAPSPNRQFSCEMNVLIDYQPVGTITLRPSTKFKYESFSVRARPENDYVSLLVYISCASPQGILGVDVLFDDFALGNCNPSTPDPDPEPCIKEVKINGDFEADNNDQAPWFWDTSRFSNVIRTTSSESGNVPRAHGGDRFA